MVFFFRKKRQKRKIQKLLETALNEMLTIVDREARMETLDQLLLESHNGIVFIILNFLLSFI